MRGNHIFAPSGVSSRVERFSKTVGSLLVSRYVDHAHAQVIKFMANVMDLVIEVFISSSNAGEPDLDTLAQFLSGVWVDMILHGKIKEPPKGTVLQTYGDDVSKQHTTQAQAFAINNAPTWYVPEVEQGSVLQTGSPELPIYPGSPNEGVLPDSTQGGLFSAYQVMPMMDPTTGRVRNHVFAVKRDSAPKNSVSPRTRRGMCPGLST